MTPPLIPEKDWYEKPLGIVVVTLVVIPVFMWSVSTLAKSGDVFDQRKANAATAYHIAPLERRLRARFVSLADSAVTASMARVDQWGPSRLDSVMRDRTPAGAPVLAVVDSLRHEADLARKGLVWGPYLTPDPVPLQLIDALRTLLDDEVAFYDGWRYMLQRHTSAQRVRAVDTLSYLFGRYHTQYQVVNRHQWALAERETLRLEEMVSSLGQYATQGRIELAASVTVFYVCLLGPFLIMLRRGRQRRKALIHTL